DQSSKKVLGYSTVKPGPGAAQSHPTYASHALVFMLGGMSSRWKQVIGYHFTCSSFDPQKVKKVLYKIIQQCEEIDIAIDAVISDIGPGNQAIWRLCGITASQFGPKVVSCKHPCAGETSRQLHFLADAPHLLKNIRGHLTREQEFILPAYIQEKYNLPSNRLCFAACNNH
ncbi:hypothetical protein HPB47_000392, partial [Ixodes persulcatus]